MTRMVSPEEFLEAFRAEEKRFKHEIAATWLGTPKWTDLMLKEESGLLAGVARKLGLKYCKEYSLIDAIMCEKIDTDHFDPDGWWAAEQLTVVIEHENYAGGANREMNRLTTYNSPLKVLITYPTVDGPVTGTKACLTRYGEIAYRADVFQDFTAARRHLVILGSPSGDLIRWDSYVYQLGEFVSLGGTS